MLLYFFTVVSLLAFAISMYRDRRQLRNGVYLLFSICGLYLCSLPWISKYFTLYSLGPIVMILLIPFLMIAVAIFLLFNFVVIVKKEGLKKSSFVPLGFALLILASLCSVTLVMDGRFLWHSHIIDWMITSALLLFLLMAIYAGFAFVVFFLYTMLYRAIPKSVNCEYIIIHGAGLYQGKVTPLLARRLDKAVEVYLRGGQKATFIVSGGQGEDESTSEAKAMCQYLIAQGMLKENIILEEQSTTTLENLQFSKKIMDARQSKYRCVFVTNDYHVLRTGMYAREVGLQAEGIGCRTALYYLPSAFIREFIAILVKYKKPYILIIGIWLIFIMISL